MKIDKLYLNLLFPVTILSIYLIILSLFSFISYQSLNLGFDIIEFDTLKTNLLNNYFNSAIKVILIMNAILLALLMLKEVTSEMKNLNIIIYNQIGIESIYITKLKLILKVSIFLTNLEYLIVVIMPYIFYPAFTFKISFLEFYCYLFLMNGFISLLAFTLVLIVKSFYILLLPVVIVFLMFYLENSIINILTFNFSYKQNTVSNLLALSILTTLDLFLIVVSFLLRKRQLQ